MRIVKFIALCTMLFLFSLCYLHLVGAADMPDAGGGGLSEVYQYGARAITPTSSNIDGFYVNKLTTTDVYVRNTLTVVPAGGGAAENITYNPSTGIWEFGAEISAPAWSLSILPSVKGYPDTLSLRNIGDIPAIQAAPPSLIGDMYVYTIPYVLPVSPTSGSREYGTIFNRSNVYFTTDACLSEITMTWNPTNTGHYFTIAGQVTRTNVVFLTPTNGCTINGVTGKALAISPTASVDLICDKAGNGRTRAISGTWGTHFNFIKWPHNF